MKQSEASSIIAIVNTTSNIILLFDCDFIFSIINNKMFNLICILRINQWLHFHLRSSLTEL